MDSIGRLGHCENASLDPARIEALIRDMGAPSAERHIGRAIDEIADWLSLAEASYRTGDLASVTRCAKYAGRAARMIGLVTLSRVAEDVAICVSTGDGAALGATLARLVRLSDGTPGVIGESWSASF